MADRERRQTEWGSMPLGEKIGQVLAKLDPEGKGLPLREIRKNSLLKNQDPTKLNEQIKREIELGYVQHQTKRPPETGKRKDPYGDEILYSATPFGATPINVKEQSRSPLSHSQEDQSAAYKAIDKRRLSPLFVDSISNNTGGQAKGIAANTRLRIHLEGLRHWSHNSTNPYLKKIHQIASDILTGQAFDHVSLPGKTEGSEAHGKTDPFTRLGKLLADVGHPMAKSFNWSQISRSFILDQMVHGFINAHFRDKHKGLSDTDFYKTIYQALASDEAAKELDKTGKWRRASGETRDKFWNSEAGIVKFIKRNARKFGLDPALISAHAIEKSIGRAVTNAMVAERPTLKGPMSKVPEYGKTLPSPGKFSPERYRKIHESIVKFAKKSLTSGIAYSFDASPVEKARETKAFDDGMKILGFDLSHEHAPVLVGAEKAHASDFAQRYPDHPSVSYYKHAMANDDRAPLRASAAAELIATSRSHRGMRESPNDDHPSVDPHLPFESMMLGSTGQRDEYGMPVLGEEERPDSHFNRSQVFDYIKRSREHDGLDRNNIVNNLEAGGLNPYSAHNFFEEHVDRLRTPSNIQSLQSRYGVVKNRNDLKNAAELMTEEDLGVAETAERLRILDRKLDHHQADQLARQALAYRDAETNFSSVMPGSDRRVVPLMVNWLQRNTGFNKGGNRNEYLKMKHKIESMLANSKSLKSHVESDANLETLTKMIGEAYGLDPQHAVEVVASLGRSKPAPTGAELKGPELFTIRRHENPDGYLRRLYDNPEVKDEQIINGLVSNYDIPRRSAQSMVKRYSEYRSRVDNKRAKLISQTLHLMKNGYPIESAVQEIGTTNNLSDDDIHELASATHRIALPSSSETNQ